MNRSIRAAISLPAEDFQALEATRRKLRKPRSEVIREALRAWFRQREIEEMERKYEAGYRKSPENLNDVEALARASLKGLRQEEW